ncbi:UNVERIFIED_CONTAM: TLC domain-containing protein [Sesamum radiatum]|uniref:TLC domain-containing protein n=1 Tax=Sesamum radiatum TaxID=300843 RepID=A0AAW2MZD4_SESRA
MEFLIFYESPLPLLTLWFIFTYILGYFIIFKNWNNKYRSEAASCLMSLAHGTPALVLSILSILQSQKSISQLDFTSPNTALQNLVLEHSIAYFLMDLFHYMVLIPSDVLFIAHHVASLYVLTTCRYLFGHGAVAIWASLFWLRLQTSCQNTWSLSRYRKVDSEKAAGVFEFLSPYFYAYFSVVRGILGPLYVYKIGLVFNSGVADGLIPRWAWVSWIVVIAGGIGGSILWVLHLWIDLYRERKTKKGLKKLS